MQWNQPIVDFFSPTLQEIKHNEGNRATRTYAQIRLPLSYKIWFVLFFLLFFIFLFFFFGWGGGFLSRVK
jgi:ABC-type multidrug transport system permease subunit